MPMEPSAQLGNQLYIAESEVEMCSYHPPRQCLLGIIPSCAPDPRFYRQQGIELLCAP